MCQQQLRHEHRQFEHVALTNEFGYVWKIPLKLWICLFPTLMLFPRREHDFCQQQQQQQQQQRHESRKCKHVALTNGFDYVSNLSSNFQCFFFHYLFDATLAPWNL